MENKILQDLIAEFTLYLDTNEAHEHLEKMSQERIDVRELMNKLSKLDSESEEFTELVLYGLLPYSKTKYAKRVSLFPAFLNIKPFFKDYNYTTEDWIIVAKKIYKLCLSFEKNPNELKTYIKEFTSDKYAINLQAGSITPILFAINSDYPVVNNVIMRAYQHILLLMGEKDKLSRNISDYPDDIIKLRNFIENTQSDLLRNQDKLDLFFYWYLNNKLNDEREIDRTDPDDVDKTIKEQLNIDKLIQITNLETFGNYAPHSLADPVRIKINEIVSLVQKKEWMLPRFQRYFDWDKNNIKELWEAIFHEYYIGSFLLWNVSRRVELGIQPISGVEVDEEENQPNALILDGQQRITSIFYAINSPDIPISSLKIKGSTTKLFFYINFYKFYNEPDSTVIEVSSSYLDKETQFEKMLFPLANMGKHTTWIYELSEYLVQETGDWKFASKLTQDINMRLNHIWQGYEIPYIALPNSMGLNQVADIFEGINTKGKLLGVFDLLIARLFKYNKDLRNNWDATLETFPKINDYFNKISKMPVYILQAMSLLYEKNSSASQKDILNIYTNIYQNTDRDFDKDWEEISEYMEKAINKLENLRDGFGVKSVKDLPFTSMIPVLTALLKLIDDIPTNKAENFEKLKQWYWSAIFSNAYSSAADSQMTMDFRDLKKYFSNEKELPRVILQMHRDINSLYLKEVESLSNARYKGVMSLIALEGAQDFDTGQNLESARQNDKDHIFPKSVGNQNNEVNINSVLNMTWMSDNTNRRIKFAKIPSVYIKEFISEKYNKQEDKFKKVLKTHLIDERAYDSMKTDNFSNFLENRNEIVLDKLKKMVGYEEGKFNTTLIQPNTPFSNSMAFINMLNNCEEYIYWLDKYFSQKGFELLAQSLENKKIHEIRIIMSVDKMTEGLRERFKEFKKEFYNIKISLKVIVDRKLISDIHDRFILSKYKAFNIPSTDIIARGQYSEIIDSPNKSLLLKEFNKFWNASMDIIDDWNKIKNHELPK